MFPDFMTQVKDRNRNFRRRKGSWKRKEKIRIKLLLTKVTSSYFRNS